MKHLGKLFISVALPFVAGAVGSYFTFPAIGSWYVYLNKPSFAPPNWVFGPAWTILYILMGVSFYLVWTAKNSKAKKVAVRIFFVQLVLNAFWSIAFFGFKNPLLGLSVIIILWFMIFLTIINFAKVSKPASYLLYPYIAWVTFASVLNLFVVLLN